MPKLGSFHTQAQEFYAGLPKTPLPKPNAIGAVELGASHPVEYHENACACGVRVSFHSFRISRAMAGVGKSERTAAMMRYLDENNIKMCCRNLIISPLTCNVVSADIGARYIHPSVEDEVGAKTEDAPSAVVRSSNMYPPYVLYAARHATQAAI